MKGLSVRVLRLLLRKVWPFEKLRVVKIRTNVIQILFPDEEAMEKILQGGLWCFNNYLLSMQQWDRLKDFTDELFKDVFF